jgi:hypothetical protein
MPDYEELMKKAGSFSQLSSDIGIARGEVPGTVPDYLKGKEVKEKAQIDRYAQGAIARQTNPLGAAGILGTAIVGAGNELSKEIPGAQDFIAWALKEKQFENRPGQTSQGSIGNVGALLQGFLSGGGNIEQGIARAINRFSQPAPHVPGKGPPRG